jgi:hypothetical protein
MPMANDHYPMADGHERQPLKQNDDRGQDAEKIRLTGPSVGRTRREEESNFGLSLCLTIEWRRY